VINKDVYYISHSIATFVYLAECVYIYKRLCDNDSVVHYFIAIDPPIFLLYLTLLSQK
jgi:hypothetical protein